MKIRRKYHNLFSYVLNHKICSESELRKIFVKLTKATDARNPALCPSSVFNLKNNEGLELPNPIYLILTRAKALQPHVDVNGTLLGFSWNASISSINTYRVTKVPKAKKRPHNGLISPLNSKTIKEGLEVLKKHKNTILTKLNLIHIKNFTENLAKIKDPDWPVTDELFDFESAELGLTLDFSSYYKETFPDYELLEIKKNLCSLPNSLFVELINRSFLIELKAFGWKINFIKTIFDKLDSFENIRQRKIPIVLLKIGVV